jgi:hypothetical protein
MAATGMMSELVRGDRREGDRFPRSEGRFLACPGTVDMLCRFGYADFLRRRAPTP